MCIFIIISTFFKWCRLWGLILMNKTWKHHKLRAMLPSGSATGTRPPYASIGFTFLCVYLLGCFIFLESTFVPLHDFTVMAEIHFWRFMLHVTNLSPVVCVSLRLESQQPGSGSTVSQSHFQVQSVQLYINIWHMNPLRPRWLPMVPPVWSAD